MIRSKRGNVFCNVAPFAFHEVGSIDATLATDARLLHVIIMRPVALHGCSDAGHSRITNPINQQGDLIRQVATSVCRYTQLFLKPQAPLGPINTCSSIGLRCVYQDPPCNSTILQWQPHLPPCDHQCTSDVAVCRSQAPYNQRAKVLERPCTAFPRSAARHRQKPTTSRQPRAHFGGSSSGTGCGNDPPELGVPAGRQPPVWAALQCRLWRAIGGERSAPGGDPAAGAGA